MAKLTCPSSLLKEPHSLPQITRRTHPPVAAVHVGKQLNLGARGVVPLGSWPHGTVGARGNVCFTIVT